MISFLRENNLLGTTYAEPFAGGAGLALRLLIEGHVGSIVLNDLDRAVYVFWHVLLTRPEEFFEWLERVEINMDNRTYYKSIFRNKQSADEFELAKATFFLNRTNVSGVLKGGVIGGNLQQGKYKIDARFNRNDLLERLRLITRYSHLISIQNLDGRIFLQQTDREYDNIFIYIDPPYVKKGAYLYTNYFKHEDHVDLCEAVNGIRASWLVSYDNVDLVKKLYQSHQLVQYSISQCTSNRTGDEILICPNRLSMKDSLSHLRNAVILSEG